MKSKMRFAMFMLVFVAEAMRARLRSRNAEAARQVMIFRAIVEFDIPTYRDKEHHKGHQHGTDLQQPLFHGRKNTKKTLPKKHNL